VILRDQVFELRKRLRVARKPLHHDEETASCKGQKEAFVNGKLGGNGQLSPVIASEAKQSRSRSL
jgi:hypothetical protein